jgi:hypothetical protein
MVVEKQLDEFVNRMRQAAGQNLQGVILYGSAAAGEFQSEFSHLNLLCLLRETSFASLAAIAPAAKWWQGKKHPAPLVMTREELERSADVFAIEVLDMQQHHRVLLGQDVLAGLHIPMHWHRAQVEYELREKLILLRQRLLEAAGRDARLWELLLQSVAAFATLFRHALIALGDVTPRRKREAVQALAARIPFDPSAVMQLLDVREYKVNRSQFDVQEVFTRYLAAVQQVVSAVDTMLDARDRADLT